MREGCGRSQGEAAGPLSMRRFGGFSLVFYYTLIGLLTLIWALLCIRGRSRRKDFIFLVLAFILLAGVAACRYGLGIDYNFIYSPQYEELLNTPGYTFQDTRFEPGFVLLELLIASFSGNYQMLFIVTGILITGLFMLYYWQNSPNVYISVFLFLTLSQYYCSLDFIRQTLAAIIATLAIPLLKKRKLPFYLLYVGIVLLAATFHKSALIMLPFLLVNLLPMNNKWVTIGFSAVTVLLYFNVTRIMRFVTQYWYKSYSMENEHVVATFEPQFAIAMLACFLILLLGQKLLTEGDSGNYLYINYAFFAFFFVLMGTRHSILDRMSIYFIFSIPVGIAIVIDALAKRKEAEIHSNRPTIRYLAVSAAVFVGALSIHHFALTRDHHGVVPYAAIWDQPFYSGYKDWITHSGDDPGVLDSFPEVSSEFAEPS